MQLQEGRLVFEAEQTKNRSERYAILPAEIYAALASYKGKIYLWERYPAELREHVKSASRHQVLDEFSPQRLYGWVVALLRDYRKQTGKDLCPAMISARPHSPGRRKPGFIPNGPLWPST